MIYSLALIRIKIIFIFVTEAVKETYLTHKPRNDSMEFTPFVAKSLLTSAQCTEVL